MDPPPDRTAPRGTTTSPTADPAGEVSRDLGGSHQATDTPAAGAPFVSHSPHLSAQPAWQTRGARPWPWQAPVGGPGFVRGGDRAAWSCSPAAPAPACMHTGHPLPETGARARAAT